MHAKFPDLLTVLGDVSGEGDVILPHSFVQGGRVNAVAYTVVLNMVVKLWIAA